MELLIALAMKVLAMVTFNYISDYRFYNKLIR